MFLIPPSPAGNDNAEHAPHQHLFNPIFNTPSLIGRSAVGRNTAMTNSEVEKDSSSPQTLSSYDYPLHFLEALTAAIAVAKTGSASGAAFIVSINNLAMIMNAYGHAGSEKVMQHLCELLQAQIPKDSLIERINRDQIGVIVPLCDKAVMADTARIFHSLIQDYGSTSPVGALHVTCSIGSVDFPKTAESAVDALDKAYIALHGTYGIAYRTYDDAHDESVLCRQQMGLANYLRRAIQENRLRMAFQPIVESSTGRIAHYEALLRVIGEDGTISSAI
jgi:predicted signal transduction protein with EAL and GGDEF domain